MEVTPDLMQNIFGFASGLIGAAVGGWFTLYATNKAIKSTYEAQEKEEERQIRSLLSSIGVELNALWQFHQRRIGEKIETIREGEAVLFYYPLTQDYFTVYNTNASFVGRLDDSELRKAIVVTYNKCKKVVDGFIYNNALFVDYQQMKYESIELGKDNLNLGAKLHEMEQYALVMQQDHIELKRYVEHLLELLEKRKISVAFQLD